MAEDIDKKLDQILSGMSSLAARCDKFDKRLDDMESGGKTPELGQEIDKDGNQFGMAKRLAADSVDSIFATTQAAKFHREKLRQAEALQKRLVENARPLSIADEAQMQEWQARADDVYKVGDMRAPAPYSYEKPISYATRVLSDLAKHSPTWKECGASGIENLAEIGGLRAAAEKIFEEASQRFARGDHLDNSKLIPKTVVDDYSGTRTTVWNNGPSFLRQFAPTRRTMRIREPKELHADQYR